MNKEIKENVWKQYFFVNNKTWCHHSEVYLKKTRVYVCVHPSPIYLFDLVAGAGDTLCDALVGPDGSGEFGIMLNNQLV